MTGPQKVFVFSLSASVAAGATFGAYVGARRTSVALDVVADRHRNDPVPPTFAAKLGDVAREVWSPTADPVPEASTGDLDPATVAELRREGIDLAEIDEYRGALRAAVASGDLAQKAKILARLKRRLDERAAAEPEAAGGRGMWSACVSVARRGREVAAGIADAVSGVWDRLLEEVDR